MLRRIPKPNLSPVQVGLVWMAILGVAIFFAFTKANPFSHPYQLSAVFHTANNIQPTSPVRIAGVDVGKVDKVEPLADGSGASRVVMSIDDKGLPIHSDAQLKIRPRIFLEGNYFVDLQPGSPSTPSLDDGSVIPINQTEAPVQLGQVLSALQSDTRQDLKTFLSEYGTKGLGGDRPGGGADAYNRAIPFMAPAFRDTSIVNQATLGTQPHDLSQLITGQQRTFAALSSDENSLKGVITNLNITARALSQNQTALAQTIPALDRVLRTGLPALQSLDNALPSLRNFAIDALPGTKSSGPMIDAMLPFLRQARPLVSDAELKGLAHDLRPTIPALAQLNEGSVGLLQQNRALSSCQNNVIIPFATAPIPDPDFPNNSGQPFYKQAPRGLVGLSGESRVSDSNSPMFRVLLGGGPNTMVYPGEQGQKLFAQTPFPLGKTRPAEPDKQPPFRPDVPCETQEAPELSAPSGKENASVLPPANPTPKDPGTAALLQQETKRITDALNAQSKGLPAPDAFAPLPPPPPPATTQAPGAGR